MPAPLPEFVSPMLAKIGQPFDSDEHLFEIKWDGTRALTFSEKGDYRLLNRRQRDAKPRYPELAFLGGLPPGIVLDGEIVVLDESGKPAFKLMLNREQATTPRRVAAIARQFPAHYVVFDVLYRDFESLMDLQLSDRREILQEIVEAHPDPALVFSDGVVGGGIRFFEEVSGREFEGVVAKRLRSTYHPGRRTEAWQKIKRVLHLHCAIIGYDAGGPTDLRSLVIAADLGGELRCVGKVGSGLTDVMRRRLLGLCRERRRETPLVPCELEGEWVEPGLYCTVSYLEETSDGYLRAPVFQSLVEE